MKRIFCAVIALCLAAGAAGCARPLPDAPAAVAAFYAGEVRDINSELCAAMIATSGYQDKVGGDQEVATALKAFMAVYLGDIQVEISDKEEPHIDKKNQTASVLVEVSCVDLAGLDAKIQPLMLQRQEEIMEGALKPTDKEMGLYYFWQCIDMIKAGGLQRTEGYQKVELSYSAETDTWQVTNGRALLDELMI